MYNNSSPYLVDAINSVIKNYVDFWYSTELAKYSNSIEDSLYCNDRYPAEYHYGNPYTYDFAPYVRLFKTGTPTPNLSCTNSTDNFTVSNDKGNKKLTYPVGLLTVDEAVLAGALYKNNDKNNYLLTGNTYYTMSPSGLTTRYTTSQTNYAYPSMFCISSWNGIIDCSSTSNYSIRPVITLKSSSIVLNGDGTKEKTYVITDTYNVKTNVKSGNGNISLSSDGVVKNDKYTVYLYPNRGYVVDKLLVNGNDETSNVKNNTYTINGVSKNYNIEVTYKKKDDFKKNTGNTLYYKVISTSLGKDSDNGIDYNKASTTEDGENKNGNGLYQMSSTSNDFYPIYYYRGPVKNNYVLFGGNCWQIIRTTDSGGIKLIYSGKANNNTCSGITQKYTVNMKYNHIDIGPTTAGYMMGYGGSMSYEDEHKLLYDSEMKIYLDKWYEENFVATGFSTLIEDTEYCNDRSYTENGAYIDYASGFVEYTGYDKYYGNNEKLNLYCPNKNDKYTVSKEYGNGALKYPIGLISFDEAIYAGLYSYYSSNTYLNANVSFWTMTPGTYKSNSLYQGSINSNWLTTNWSLSDYAVRPVISLKNNVSYISGDGSEANPYKITSSEYKVTTNVEGGNGTITSTKLNVIANDNLDLNIKPNEGYVVDKLVINGEDVTTKVKNNNYVIKNIKEDQNVKVTFKEEAKSYLFDSIYNMMSYQSKGEDRDINFGNTDNHYGVYTDYYSLNDQYPMHYYRGSNVKNNVEFGGFCWKILRTTETGGSKILYSGTAKYDLNLIDEDKYEVVSNDNSYKYVYTEGTKKWKVNAAHNPGYKAVFEFKIKEENEYYLNYLLKLSNYQMNEKDFKENLKSDYVYIYKNNKLIKKYSWNTTTQVSLGKLKSSDVIKIEYEFDNEMYPNNYLEFAIGTKTSENLKCNNTNTETELGQMHFNSHTIYEFNDTGYSYKSTRFGHGLAGYMYGTLQANSYEEEHANINDSDVKYFIDKWYENHFLGTEYEKYIEDTVYCNDRSLSVDFVGTNITKGFYGNGYGNNFLNTTYGGAHFYLSSGNYKYAPYVKCRNKNDMFTVSDKIGNGALKYPIALIEAREYVYAGAKLWDSNNNFAYSNSSYLTLSPLNSSGADYGEIVRAGTGSNATSSSSPLGVRPVLSLSSSTILISGDGS